MALESNSSNYNNRSVSDLVSSIEGRNVKLWVDRERLRYKATKGVVTEEILRCLNDKKVEIIKYLNQRSSENIYFGPMKNIVGDIEESGTDEQQAGLDMVNVEKENSKHVTEMLDNKELKTNIVVRKELHVKPHRDITAHLYYSLPLSVILTDKKLYPWYYEHFVEIHLTINPKSFLDMNFTGIAYENWTIYNEIIDIIPVKFGFLDNKLSIIDYVIKNIDSEYYLILRPDWYYLPNCTHYYKKIHSFLESLIYGYDIEKKKILAVSLDPSEGMVKYEYDFEDFVTAFESWKQHCGGDFDGKPDNFLLRKRKFSYEYPFDLERFLKRLKNYLLSRVDSCHDFFSNPYALEYNYNYVYGFAVYEYIIDRKNDFINGDASIIYQSFHILYEHKKGLYYRLKFIEAKYVETNNKLNVLIDEYAKILKKCNDLRLLIIKSNLKESSFTTFYNSIQNKLTVEKIIECLSEVKELERDVLQRVVNELDSISRNI